MKTAVQLRRFSPADLDRILEIERVCFPIGGYKKKRFENLFHKHPRDFIVAQLAQEIIGYVMAYNKAGTLEFDSVAVDRGHRNLGVGTRLMKFMLNRSKRKRIKKAALEVRTTNQKAIRLYKKFGFEITKTLKHYCKDGADAYRMEKC